MNGELGGGVIILNKGPGRGGGLRGRIQVVRTVPHTVRRCFESEANSCEKEWERPPCHCTPEFIDLWEQAGTVTVRDGHFCLLPVSVQFDGAELHSKDPLRLAGSTCRDTAHRPCSPVKRSVAYVGQAAPLGPS